MSVNLHKKAPSRAIAVDPLPSVLSKALSVIPTRVAVSLTTAAVTTPGTLKPGLCMHIWNQNKICKSLRLLGEVDSWQLRRVTNRIGHGPVTTSLLNYRRKQDTINQVNTNYNFSGSTTQEVIFLRWCWTQKWWNFLTYPLRDLWIRCDPSKHLDKPKIK